MRSPLLVIIIMVLVLACNTGVEERSIEPDTENRQPPNEKGMFSNPVLIQGTSFGVFFQSLHRNGRHEEMLRFTDSEARARFGDDSLTNYYVRWFHMDFELGKITGIDHGDTTILMYSNAKLLGTRVLVRVPVIVENDSCRLLLTKFIRSGFNYSFFNAQPIWK